MIRGKYLGGTLATDTGNKLSLNNKTHPKLQTWLFANNIVSNFIQTQLTCSQGQTTLAKF